LPVYSRASLSRTAATVVALFPTASAAARELRAGSTLFLARSIEHLQKVPAGPIGNEIPDSFEPHGFVGLRDHAAAQLTERIRKVE
jgi:TRAP-type C4-dicarboxylate transport system substrate-binding protein